MLFFMLFFRKTLFWNYFLKLTLAYLEDEELLI